MNLFDIVGEGFADTIGLSNPPLDPKAQMKMRVRQLIADYSKNPEGLYNIAKKQGPNSIEAIAYNYLRNPTGRMTIPNLAAFAEAIVAGGHRQTSDDEVKKIIYNTLHIDKPTGKEALEAAITMLAERPKTRTVAQLMQGLYALATRSKIQLDPFLRNILMHYNESVQEDNWHGSTDSWHDGQNAWASDKHEMVEYVIQGPSPDDSQSPIPGNVEEDFGDNPVAGAIVRRIMTQHTDLLKQYGPDLVGRAVDEVADYVGDVDEIGSSDVSGWVKQVERMLRENPPEAFGEQGVAESSVDNNAKLSLIAKKLASETVIPGDRKDFLKAAKRFDRGYTTGGMDIIYDMDTDPRDDFFNYCDHYGAVYEQGVAEAQTDYQKRRQRERDVDAGKPVTKQRQPKMTDYQKRRARDRKDTELGEAVTFDRTKVPDYPQDPATIKHRTDTAKAILSDPKSDPESRKQASRILANTQKDMKLGENTNYWQKLQDERSSKLRSLINELEESTHDMKIAEFLDEDWQKVNRRDKTSGMSRKAVKAYRRENPGSKLQTAVTTKPSKLKKGSKASKRRKSFCARMKGMKKSRASAKTKRDPNSNINKALRRWNCESVEDLAMMLENAMTWYSQHLIETKNQDMQKGVA